MRTTVTGPRPRAGRELVLLAALYLAYSASRLVADPDPGAAVGNARDLLHLETLLHLDVERWLNEGLTAVPVLPLVASYWYSVLHYVVTPAVLVWVYRSHPGRYRVARNTLVAGSALGIVGFAMLPMAPPRMLPGYVDTLASTSGSGWWGSDASAPRGLGALTNELAAMPSLHVGWAVWCAGVVLLCTRRRWVRVLAVAYPVLTTVVVVATANHYLLDAVAGVAVLAAGAAVAVRLPARWGGPTVALGSSGSARSHPDARLEPADAWEERDGRAAA
ncbi:MAG TPA: phosphatase PAP2 family protein [Actinomycetes bacterium]|nr:phosphatase PAP2 family protein [Actinomycetes bacterium]